jgi:hypothetical protein
MDKCVNYNATPRFQGVHLGIAIPIFGVKGYKARTDAAAIQVLAQQKQRDYLQTQLQSQLRQSTAQFVFWKNNVAVLSKHGIAKRKIHRPKRQPGLSKRRRRLSGICAGIADQS